MKILAGIVLYNPSYERLKANLGTVKGQVDEVVFIANSELSPEVEKLISAHTVIYNGENLGVAHALNQVFEMATKGGYDWVLTLDQDSVCSKKLISIYKDYVNLPDAGIITCSVADRNFGVEDFYKNQKSEIVEVEICITSAALNSVKAYLDTAGFDDNLFIDSVDFDYCFKLLKKGYKIYRTKHIGLLQEIGEGGRIIRLPFKSFTFYSHSAFRYFYIGRNEVILNKRYGKEFKYYAPLRSFARVVRDFLLLLAFEDSKFEKAKAYAKGVFKALF